MCIISVAPPGTLKDSEFWLKSVTNGCSNNNDGFGFVIKRADNDFIEYHKGIWKEEELLSLIAATKPTKEDLLVVHARIRSVGKVNDLNTHPFVVSDIDEELDSIKGTTKNPMLVHNGTFSNYGDLNLSDTYCITRDLFGVPHIQRFITEDPALFKETFQPILGYNKIIFVLPNKIKQKDDKWMITIGDFTIDKGYMFSNSGYSRCAHKYTPVHVPHVKRSFEDNFSKQLKSANMRNTVDLFRNYDKNKLTQEGMESELSDCITVLTRSNAMELSFVAMENTLLLAKDRTYIVEAVHDISTVSPYDEVTKGIFFKMPQFPNLPSKTIEPEIMLEQCHVFPKSEYKQKYKDLQLLTKRLKNINSKALGKIFRGIDSSADDVLTLSVKSAGKVLKSAVIEWLVQTGHYKAKVMAISAKGAYSKTPASKSALSFLEPLPKVNEYGTEEITGATSDIIPQSRSVIPDTV